MTNQTHLSVHATDSAPDLKGGRRRKLATGTPGTPDRLPPHSLEAERAAVGCAILSADLAPDLHPEWFYDLRCRTAAQTLLSMAAEGKPIDEATLYQRLLGSGVSDPMVLVQECLQAAPSSAGFSYWREILVENLLLRLVIRTGQGAIEAAQEAHRDSSRKPLDVLDDYEREVLSIRQSSNGVGNGEADLRAILLELQADYDQAAREGRPAGVMTGFVDLDKLLGGLKQQQLMVIAARPSVGKTALALNIAARVSVDDLLPVGFFSLEMSAKELTHRLACSRGRIDGIKLNEGKASAGDIKTLTVAHAQLARALLHICDSGGLTMAQLTARARRMVQQHGIKLLVVDYLGLLRSGEKGRSRYEETTLVSGGLKALAKELNVPLIALCQLNRDTEREGRPPRMSDLRDSGAIEQDADIISLLHRSEDQTTDEQQVSLIVAKNRNGRTGKVDLVFHRAFTRFESTPFRREGTT